MTDKILSALLIGVTAASAASVQADASRGARVLQQQGCTKCHDIGGTKSVSTTALSRPLNREYTPSGFNATLWNHAPQMWSAMREKDVAMPSVSEQNAADIVAYFASLRYFEPMGDAGRGARLFLSKKCVDCHAISGRGTGSGLPVAEWQSLGDPVDLAAAMWNHSGRMQTEMAKRSMRQPELSAQDLSDILVYIRNVPNVRKTPLHFEVPSLEGAETLLQTWNCATCHKDELSFDRRADERSMTAIAAGMWNHSNHMLQHPAKIPPEELKRIISWIWARQFEQPAGSVARGRRVAEDKKCTSCHEGGGAPSFGSMAKSGVPALRMTAALWKHGPKMQSALEAKGIKWPKFSAAEMRDLTTWFQAGAAK